VPFLKTPDDVRVVEISGQSSWLLAYQVNRRAKFRVSAIAAACLVVCVRPQEQDVPEGSALFRLPAPVGVIREVCSQLLHLGLLELSDDDNPPQQSPASFTDEAWLRHGWIESADYHEWTADYPFIPGEGPEAVASQANMINYSAIEPDVQRFKVTATGSTPRLPLSGVHADPEYSEIQQRLFAALKCAFGVVTWRPVSWVGSPLAMRAAPSGGARHPVEGYLVATDVIAPPGLYHVQVETLELVRLPSCDGRQDPAIPAMFSNLVQRVPFEIQGVLIITTVFERNMYRYRAPRTFRSVHMDAGHFSGVVEAALLANSFVTCVNYAFDEGACYDWLQIDPLTEAVQLTIAFRTL
jgi:hypothetical protein